MSFKAITWAMEQETTPVFKPLTKFVLVTMADLADQDGKCYPSIAYISGVTGLGDSTVRRHLHVLAEVGLLEIVWGKRADGSYSSNTYHLALEGVLSERQGILSEMGGAPVRNGRCNEPAIDPLYVSYTREQGIELQWAAFVDMRKSIKKPLTPYAMDKVVRKLAKLSKEHGQKPGDLLDQSTISCWQDVFPIKERRQGIETGIPQDHPEPWELARTIAEHKLPALCREYGLTDHASPGHTFDEWRQVISTQIKRKLNP